MNAIVRRMASTVLSLSLFATSLHAETAIPQYTTNPTFYEFLPNAASDWVPMFKSLDPRDHAEAYAGILGLTAVLLYYDEDILIGSQKEARHLHLISDTDTGAGSRVVYHQKIAGIGADFRLPQGTNGTMYYIGDGITSLGVLAGITTFGLITDDKRALNTASQFMESLVLTGSYILPSKYLAGRESPFRRSEDGGVWRPAAGVKAYLSNVSKHDAFPSGHVATVMSGLMILHQNYPEKLWILPLGYTALGALMFAMLNNGEHWAGDYPVGISIGYMAAKTVFNRRKPADYNPDAPAPQTTERQKPYELLPFANGEGVGLMFNMRS